MTLAPESEQDRAWLARECTSLGKDAWLRGRPDVSNQGRLTIGARFRCASTPVASHLITLEKGVIEIGDDVSVSHGTGIFSEARVRIGDGTRIGPYVVIADTDFHLVGDRDARPKPRPIEIGRGVKLGSRVIILPGVTIGDGATVIAGSTVAGVVAEGAVVSGVPAMVQRPARHARGDLQMLVQRIFDLPNAPALSNGPAELAQWDSLGTLRLLLAIEQDLEVRLDEGEMARVKSVADLAGAVERARAKQVGR